MLDRLEGVEETHNATKILVSGTKRMKRSVEFRLFAVWKSREPCPVLSKVEKEKQKQGRQGREDREEIMEWETERKRMLREKERERERERRERQREWEEHANLLNYKIILPYDYYVRYTLYILYLCLNNRC